MVLTIEEELKVNWNCSLFAFLVSNSRVIARVSTLITDQSSNIGCKVHCEALQEDIDDGKGEGGNKFTVAYDKLVIATGAEASTFGITGVHEHALFLRDVKNAMDIRTKLLLNLMKCEIPGLPEAPPAHSLLLLYLAAAADASNLLTQFSLYVFVEIGTMLHFLCTFLADILQDDLVVDLLIHCTKT